MDRFAFSRYETHRFSDKSLIAVRSLRRLYCFFFGHTHTYMRPFSSCKARWMFSVCVTGAISHFGQLAEFAFAQHVCLLSYCSMTIYYNHIPETHICANLALSFSFYLNLSFSPFLSCLYEIFAHIICVYVCRSNIHIYVCEGKIAKCFHILEFQLYLIYIIL